jgi:SNF2-related domain
MKRQRPDSRRKASSALCTPVDAPDHDNKNDSENDTDEDTKVALTPHTLRLLKLIHDGNHEHASMAALQLATITAQSSPLVLWDVLGNLQAFLVNPRWQTRQNASVAMEGVARHLPLPSRQRFLCHVLDKKRDYLWLTLIDFQREQQVVLKQGRLLFAHSVEDEASVERTEETIRQMDQQHLKGNSQDSGDPEGFVQRRVERQRRILAQRIGLSGLLLATGGASNSCLFDTITSEDLKGPPPQAAPSSRPLKRKRNENNRDQDAEGAHHQDAQSVRALLVLEMKRQLKSSESISFSHNNSQILLATELLYRVFDPNWHVRHGALMGLLALLRAWYNSSGLVVDGDSANVFGAWPQDILARCLCVLLLDRFGDYSGTTTSGIQGAESGCVVAPVRETACQLLSLVWHMAPSVIQSGTLQVLCQLAEGKSYSSSKSVADDHRAMDWEIRHGALLALKYIAAVQVTSKSKTALTEISHVASACLDDDSDDTQSVAAQILSTILTGSGRDLGIGSEDMLRRVWRALERTRSVSSSLLDLISLCSLLLQQNETPIAALLPPMGLDCRGQGVASVLEVFRGYLQHDLFSVRIAALRSIAQVLYPIWRTTVDGGANKSDEFGSFSGKLPETLFLLFFDEKILVSPSVTEQLGNPKSKSSEEADHLLDSQLLGDYRACRTLAWNNLVRILGERARREEQRGSLDSMTYRLTLIYFGLQPQSHGESMRELYRTSEGQETMSVLVEAADALSDIICSISIGPTSLPDTHLDLIEIGIKTLLKSPWATQCEAACLLFRALATKICNGMPRSANAALLQVLNSSLQSVTAILTLGQDDTAPPCLSVEVRPRTKEILQDRELLLLRDTTFLQGVELAQSSASTSRISDSVHVIGTLWKHAITTKGGDGRIFSTSLKEVVATRGSMRYFAVLAGAALADRNGPGYLKKATPLVRPLMTSLKNEVISTRRLHTCVFAAEMLCMMSVEVEDAAQGNAAPFAKAREKVLNTMCDTITAGLHGTENDEHQGESSTFSQVIQLFLGNMASRLESLEHIVPIWIRTKTLLLDPAEATAIELLSSLNLLAVVCGNLPEGCALTSGTISRFLPRLVLLACQQVNEKVRSKSRRIVHSLCLGHTGLALPIALPVIIESLNDRKNDSRRLSACQTLQGIVEAVGTDICPFVRRLLHLVMSLMADPLPGCAKLANAMFACLVRVAPLVPSEKSSKVKEGADSVIEHLIHGKPLPQYELPPQIQQSLITGGVSLRQYQMDGVAWLKFLQSVNLNGALCDSMGLGKQFLTPVVPCRFSLTAFSSSTGKTLQALLGIAIAHVDGTNQGKQEDPKSLVVCPASVVGHWEAEIERFFPNRSFFTCLALIGNARERKCLWEKNFSSCNLVVTSYSVLRTDVSILSSQFWRFCCLDEGHVIRNRNTGTRTNSNVLLCA